MSDGNESVGKMWQETKVFEDLATLEEVMNWAIGPKDKRGSTHNRKRVTITRPHSSEVEE